MSAGPAHPTWTHDIRHLFTERDVTCMHGVIELNNYDSVKHHAKAILGQVQVGNMPPAGSGEEPWSPSRIKLFEEWIAGGCQK